MTTPTPSQRADARVLLRAILQRIATGPEHSKAISREQARAGMEVVLNGAADPVQAGVFLIALRMKRETDEECIGILDAVREHTRSLTAPVGEVVDIADPYDGFLRTLPASPFLPAVLAACGLPAFSHGLECVGPKFGVTHRQVLRAAGAPVDGSCAEAAARLARPDVGWSYLDQGVFCPSLHALVDLRRLIVKRPVLTTVEVLAGPIRGAARTHLVTGYVHRAYPRLYAVLARHAGFDSALIVRGAEGGVVPPLQQAGRVFYYHARGPEHALEVEPAELGVAQPVRAVPIPAQLRGAVSPPGDAGPAPEAQALARAAAEAGLAALDGAPGPTRAALIYAGALCLWHARRHGSPARAADAVREVLDSGRASERFRAGSRKGSEPLNRV